MHNNVQISLSPYVTSFPKGNIFSEETCPYSFSKGNIFLNKTYPFEIAFLMYDFPFHTFYFPSRSHSHIVLLCNSCNEKHPLKKFDPFLNIPPNQIGLKKHLKNQHTRISLKPLSFLLPHVFFYFLLF